MPYPVMNTILDAGFPNGLCNYWLSSFTKGFDDGLIDDDGRALRDRAVADVGDRDRALPRRRHAGTTRPRSRCRTARRAGTCCSRRSGPTPPTTRRTSRWTRETHAALAPHLAGRRWLNYLGDDQARRRDPRRVRAQLRPTRRDQGDVRPRERLPPQPQHPAGFLANSRSTRRVRPEGPTLFAWAARRDGRMGCVGAGLRPARRATRAKARGPVRARPLRGQRGQTGSSSASGGSSSSARRRCRTLRERTPISLPSSTTGTRSASRSSRKPERLLERDVRADRVARLLGDRRERRSSSGRGPRRRRARPASCA